MNICIGNEVKVIEEIRLDDIHSIEFSELIDDARVELENNNPE